MNRSAFVVASVVALLLFGFVALRFGGEESGEEQSALEQRRSVRKRGGERLDAEPGGQGAIEGRRAPERRSAAEGGAEPAAKKRIDRPASDPFPSAAERRRDSSERGRDSRRPPAMDGLSAGGGIDDDENFRAAADALPERDDARAGADALADEDPDPAEDVAHEPPATPVVDDSMTYNSGDYRFSLDSPFQIQHSSDAGTVALWVQPEWSADNNEDAGMIELGDGLFRVYKNVNVLRFEVMSDNPERSAGLSIAEWQPGEWHSISATWESQRVTFYVDGQPVGAAIDGSFGQQGNTPLTIGTLGAGDQPVAPGTVSDVSVRNRALPASEIARLYNRSAVPRSPQ